MNSNHMKKNYPLLFLILLGSSLILIMLSLGCGYYKLSIGQIMRWMFAKSVQPFTVEIIWNIRLPRVISAFLIGMSLSASGAVFQGVFRNPLVSSDMLGVVSGCGVGACLAILLNLSYFYIQIFAFVFGLLTVALTYFLSTNIKYTSKATMILCGVMVGSFCMAIISLLKFLADTNEQLPEMTFWLMGSITKTSYQALIFCAPFIIVGFILLSFMSGHINLLTLSVDEAKSLGVNIKRSMFVSVFAATMMCSAAVCLGGRIGWIGLMVPHIVRAIVGSDYRRLLPISALIGGIFLLLVDDLIRSFFVMEVPIGLLISFLGAPFFYILIRKGGIK